MKSAGKNRLYQVGPAKLWRLVDTRRRGRRISVGAEDKGYTPQVIAPNNASYDVDVFIAHFCMEFHFEIGVVEREDISIISIAAPIRSRIEHMAMYFVAFAASALTPLNLYFTMYMERSMLSVIARL